jgi:flagellar biosynthesis/type III secretory pathway chaperone
MNFNWENLVEALRDELREYGALRNLLDEQQKAIFGRNADKVTEINTLIAQQIEGAAALRGKRESMVAALAASYDLPARAGLLELRKKLPTPAQPLLKALSDEINSMVDVLRHRSRQNQMLLARTCETMERTLRALRPDNFTKTYSARGALALKLGPVGGYIQAAT